MKDVKILMVDDDAEDRDLLKEIFEELGHEDYIHFEENGEKAMQYLEKRKAQQLPSLIILDLNMPKLNGRQTLEQIKNDPHLQHITTLIYSTSVNPLEREECLSLGAHSYVIKPVSYSESLRIANQFLSLCQ